MQLILSNVYIFPQKISEVYYHYMHTTNVIQSLLQLIAIAIFYC